MSDPRHALGESVEAAVADWLTRAGWTIVARRVRSAGGGEVDIVAVDAERILVAVEVRARRHERPGSAEESVDGRRVARMRRTLATIAPSAPPHAGLRIDLVTAGPAGRDDARWRLRRTAGIDAG
jgi:Holliday junction resolvase-like predicted endonuclease